MLFLAPPRRNASLAWFTRPATTVGSGVTDNEPASIRVMSRRSLIRLRIWSACSSMIRKKSPISAGLSVDEAVSKVAAEPLMVVSGVRSSWLTMLKNSPRSRCRSSSGVMSCTVATTDTTAPSPEKIGVALMTVVTAWPSGS